MPTPEAATRPPRLRGRALALDVARQLGVVAAGAAVYLVIQQFTAGKQDVAIAHAQDVLALEQRWGIAWEHAIQQATLGLPGGDAFFTGVYVWGYFPALIAIIGWLYVRDRRAFLAARTALLVSAAIGFTIYAFYPCAPPWIAGGDWVVDTVADGWSVSVARPPSVTNHLGALPSFHVGWVVVLAVVLATTTRSRTVWVLCAAYPLLMAWAVVATGNHWVLDVPAGVALAAVGLLTLRLHRPEGGPAKGAFGPVAGGAPAEDWR